jgi:ribonuclease Z
VPFSVTILGSSSAVPTSARFPSAHLVNIGERIFLIDAGEGTQIQLRRQSVRFGKINHIFISHAHGDHVFGLFGLLSTFSLLKRETELHIYSHSRLKQILDQHLMHFHEDGLPFPIVYHFLNENSPQIVYEDMQITVTSFPLSHRIPTCGFLFREKPLPLNIKKEMIDYYSIPVAAIPSIKHGDDYTLEDGTIIENQRLTHAPCRQRAYAYCSDTAYTEDIIPLIKDIDLLYHEATFSDELSLRARETGHSTSTQAATIAKKAKVRKLIIGHFSARYKDLSILLEEARRVFPETCLASEGEVFSIKGERIPSSDK